MPGTTALSLTAAGRYLYGGDFAGIWRAKLDGTGVNRHFIRLPGDTEGLVIH
jgi:hypothetical protein